MLPVTFKAPAGLISGGERGAVETATDVQIQPDRDLLTKPKLLICDDHPPIRTAVTYVAREINRDIRIVEAGDASEALAAMEQNQDVDLILVDLYMPGMSGLDLLSELKQKYPTIPVVVLSSDETRSAVVDALQRGATGYICKSSSTELLAKFLEHALSGRVTLPTAVVYGTEAETGADSAPAAAGRRLSPDLGLTPRQTDVLGCLLRGMSTKQICRELGLSEGTVKSHTVAIFRALNVTSRAQVVIEASRRGVTIGGKAS
jgi:DNA-binding NarL/FixJ family response regulator